MLTKIAIIATPVPTLFLCLLLVATLHPGFCYGSFNAGCSQTEREALLQFKHDLKGPLDRLASWAGNGDCCSWPGVLCDNFTGRVLELHLGAHPEKSIASGSPVVNDAYEKSRFEGKISPSLVNLKHLRYLDLSENDFGGTPIPTFLGSMGSLKYLNLSRAGFGGKIPHELGNLSNLLYLNLRSDHMPYVENLHWLSGLSSLEVLDLGGVDLQKALNWLELLNALPSLVELHLPGCQLLHVPPLLPVNFSSLSFLDLSANLFVGSSILRWVSGLKTLSSLNLANIYFQGPILNEIGNMTSLRQLDLSYNLFNSSIPNGLYGLTHLEQLNLGRNELQGPISSAIGNMTSLITLSLSFNGELEVGSGGLFKNLCNLRNLYLSGTKLKQEMNDFFESLSGCVSHGLESLQLVSCQLSGNLISKQLGNLKNLASLSLSGNQISGSIPVSLGELTALKTLSLAYNKLNGTFPVNFGKLQKLEELYISNNFISGPVPTSLRELVFMRVLDLSYNQLNGTLPVFFGGLKQLTEVRINYNCLEGEVSEIHFENLTNLQYFDAYGNQLKLKVTSNWIPPLSLGYLVLGSWLIGPQFPTWLRSLQHLYWLDLSNSRISSSIPIWFWDFSSQLRYLNFSHNQIHGALPSTIEANLISSFFDLSFNNFTGALPSFSSTLNALDLSNNSLSGSISKFLCHKMHEVKKMQLLHLGGNLLSGEIPNCWTSWKYLTVLNLRNNKFMGNIPKSIGDLNLLELLHLRHNKLSGELPLSLKNCTNLVTFDISENELSGNIPTWIGETLSGMRILKFRSNKFDGHIPKELCHLASLQILDLAQNQLSGNIPSCISNFTAMTTQNDSFGDIYFDSNSSGPFINIEILVMKGQEVEYSSILKFVRSIDLSNNKLYGEIPEEVTTLRALQSLNLSRNLLEGRLPENMGVMQELEALDLSFNQFVGEIPPSMASLTFLSYLNLSNNELSGRIPLSTQLQSFDRFSFGGNKLCGRPLEDCSVDDTPSIENGKEEASNGRRIEWFYVSMALGFAMGFWGVIGPIVVNRRWRHAYFCFLEYLGNRIFRKV